MLRKLIPYRQALRSPPLTVKLCNLTVPSDITPNLLGLFLNKGKITYVFLTRLPLSLARSLDLHA